MLDTSLIPPASGGPPAALIAILHGYGANGADLMPLAQAWRQTLPDAAFAVPDAHQPCADSPFGGRQWWPLDFERVAESSIAGAAAARPVIDAWLARLWHDTGLGPQQTVLTGFSQGAMLALHAALAQPEPLAGVVGFSGALIPPTELGIAPKLPVLLAHGDLDGVVEPMRSRSAARDLEALGYDVDLVISPAVAHSIAPEGFAAATAFLGRVLPRRA